jgi:hypothetical protein
MLTASSIHREEKNYEGTPTNSTVEGDEIEIESSFISHDNVETNTTPLTGP